MSFIDEARGSFIDIGRFGKNMLEWTVDKLLKGAGSDADPTEIAHPIEAASIATDAVETAKVKALAITKEKMQWTDGKLLKGAGAATPTEIDHDKAAHDALNIDADTVDGDHKTDLENTMDSKITTHAGDASAHHAKTTFTELAGGEDKKPSTSATWEDWDLSAIIGAGAQAVEIAIDVADATDTAMLGVRKNGSALTRLITRDFFGLRGYTTRTVECDSNRIIEIYHSDTTQAITFQVAGYWS